MSVTLGYWGIRGIAQPLRFLLAHLGVEYNDKQYTTAEEWYGKDRPALQSEFKSIPYLIDGDVVITESTAIPIHLIKKHNRNDLLGQKADGSYSESEVRVQQVLSVLRDLQVALITLLMNPEFASLKEKTYTSTIGPLFAKLVSCLGEKKFIVGELTYADFVFYEYASMFRHLFPETATPTVLAFIERFENLSGVKEYIAKPTQNLKVYFPPGRVMWTGPQ